MVKNNYLKFVFVIFGLLFMMNSVYSASWYDASCWFNDQPVLDVNIIHYDENGVFQSNFHLQEDNSASYTLTEGDILQFDFGDTTDDENNIRSERIFWLNEDRNDIIMNIQSNSVVTTTSSTSSFSSSKFDFYDYLLTGQSKPQYFQENSQGISYNDGNPQFHYVKTFKPKAGTYEVLFRITDDCADSDGSDEVYKFISVVVNPTPVQQNDYTGEVQDNFDRADGNILTGTATNGNAWSYNNPATFFISNGEVYGQAVYEEMMGYIWSMIELQLQPTSPNYFSVDVKLPNDPTNNPDIWFAGRGTTNYGFGLVFTGTGDLLGWNSQRSNYVTLMTLPTDEQYHTYELRNIDVVGKTIDLYYDGGYVTTWSGFEQNTNSINRISIYPQGTASNTNTFIYFDNIKSGNYPLETYKICDGDYTVSSSNIDILIYDGCSNININQSSFNNFNLYYDGNLHTQENPLDVNINYLNNNNYGSNTLNLYTDKIKLNFQNPNVVSSMIVNLNGNLNTIDSEFIGTKIYNPQITNLNGNILHTASGSSTYSLAGTNNLNIEINNNKMNIIGLASASNMDLKYSDINFLTTSLNPTIYLAFNNIYSTEYNNFVLPIINSNNILSLSLDTSYTSINSENYFENLNNIQLGSGFSMDNEIYIQTSFINIFKFKTNSNIFDTSNLMGFEDVNYYIGKNVNGKYIGNAYLDQNGDDIYTCSGNVIDVIYSDKLYKVCDTPVLIASSSDMAIVNIYDYIIVTDESAGGIDPIDPPETNKKPVAVLEVDNNEVEVGQSICWDISGSYDTDGTIVKKTLWEDNVAYTSTNTRCITKNSAQSMTLQLEVEDNDGDIDTKTKYIVWKNTDDICSINTAPELNISYSQYDGNLYYLNMTTNDIDGDDLEYAWSVNGEVIKGKNILTSIDWSQTVMANVLDGCELVSDNFYIDVGQNFTDPIEDIEVNLVCSQNGFFAPTTVNCEVVYDVKDNTLKNITWIYDNNIITENSGVSFYIRNVGDTEEHMITTTITTNEGKSKSDYYRFNLVTKIGDSGGDSIIGGGGTSKDVCNIDITDEITINEDNLVVPIIITNNDAISWSPDYKFEDVWLHDSSKGDLSITNIIGTIQADETKEIGVAYSWDNINSVNTQNKIIFTSANCEDIEIIVNVEIGNQSSFLIFSEFDELLLNDLSPSNLLNATVIKSELLGSDDALGGFKIWQLSGVLALLFTIVLWKWKPFKGTKRKPKTKQNIITKGSIILVLTIFFTIVLIKAFRWLFELL